MLTERGKDYLKATGITIAIVCLAGPAIAAALTFSLAVMGGLSLVLLRTGWNPSEVSVDRRRLRMLKRQQGSVVLRLGSLGSQFARVSSVSLANPFGLDGQAGKLDRGATELTFVPAYAGLFQGIRATVMVTDALGLFKRSEVVDLDLVVESLPVSLLLPDVVLPVSPIVQGEASTGGRGAGQELYSIEPYLPGSDAKDVMWKRLARSNDDSIQVRVREASAKAVVSMLTTFGSADPKDRVKYTDLAAEATTQLGKKLVSLGVTVELSYRRGNDVSSVRASTSAELATAMIKLWTGDSRRPYESALSDADLLVVDQIAFDDERSAGLLGRGPVLLVRKESAGRNSWGNIFTFTGHEDLTALAEALLEA